MTLAISYSVDDNKSSIYYRENNGQEVIGYNMQRINKQFRNASLLIGLRPYWFCKVSAILQELKIHLPIPSLKLSPLPATEQVWVNYPNTL